ncbi:MAG: TIGR02186 family protein [Pseudomonadota bacterium]
MRGLLVILAIMIAAATARANDIAVALADDIIEIDADFAGADVFLFGAIEGAEDPESFDIIAVISGPAGDFAVRKRERRGLIWIPGAPVVIADAPRLHLSVATRAVGDIAPLPDLATNRIGADRAFKADAGDATAPPDYRSAFLAAQRERGLYRDEANGVEFPKGALFTIETSLPAETPIGDYTIAVFLYKDGALIADDAATLRVNKVGLERQIYALAHGQPLLYGLLCVGLSLLAGWIAGAAFRKS